MPEPQPPQAAHAAPHVAASGSGALAPDTAADASLGESHAARAVNGLLLALSRTARSFTLYDAHNEAVRGFLDDLREKFRAALEAGGALELEVRPFELAWRGDVVYLERERERSLAFRLFRDGVRRLRFDPALTWDEILGLVEILSLRYTGVRQQEDDLVTLLQKAGFAHVAFAAVEGFVPDEEIPEGEPRGDDSQPARPLGAPPLAPPDDFDLPLPALPALPAPVRPVRAELSAETLAALRLEETAATLPDDALELALELVTLAGGDGARLFDEVAPTLVEIADFLAAEGAFGALGRLADGVLGTPLAGLISGEPILKRVLSWAGGHAAGTPPPELFALLDRLPGEPLGFFLDALASAPAHAPRGALRAIVEHLAPRQPQALLERLNGSDARTASELVAVVARAAPGRVGEAALALRSAAEPGLQLAVLSALEGAPPDPQVARMVTRWLPAGSPEVIAAAATYLAAHAELRAADTILARLQDGQRSPSDEVAAALGDALARVAPQQALARFAEWLEEPRSFLGRLVDTGGRRAQHWAAAAGLARLPGDEAERLLRTLSNQCTGELRRHCQTLLAARPAGRPPAGAGHAG